MPKRDSKPPRDDRPDRTGDDDLIAERLRRHLEFLGLTLTFDELDERLAWATRERPGATALLEHVLGAEAAHKLEQRIARRIDTSGLVERKALEAFEWDFQPKLDKALILELARLDFVRRREDLVITGKAGTGKSHILKAFGMRACEQAITMRYARCVDLLDDLHAGLADGTYRAASRPGRGPDLLIIDDVGLGQVKKRDDEPTARTRSTTSSIVGTAASPPPSRPTSRSATGAATSATPPSPPPSSTGSRCTRSASTSTVRATASTSRRSARKKAPLRLHDPREPQGLDPGLGAAGHAGDARRRARARRARPSRREPPHHCPLAPRRAARACR